MEVVRELSPEAHDSLVNAKLCSAFILGLAALCCSVLPIILIKKCGTGKSGALGPKAQGALDILLRIGGGILIATTFLHLLPEVREGLDGLIEAKSMPADFPIAIPELVMCIGFFLMYGVEELAHLCLTVGRDHEHEHSSYDVDQEGGYGNDDNPATPENTPLLETNYNHHRRWKRHEGHSHVVSGSPIRGILIIIALSIHQIFEGLAVGLEGKVAEVWVLMGAIAAHKSVIAIFVGVEMASARTSIIISCVCVAVFAVASPLGIGIGVLLSSKGGSEVTLNIVSVILQGLATGTLLYVVFFEILSSGREKGGLKYFFAVVVGFVLMSILICCFKS